MERAELSRLLASDVSAASPPVGREPTVIAERDPVRFATALAGASAGNSDVFLADPEWGERERSQLEALLKSAASVSPGGERGWLMIPTGGSSGALKFARHDQDTLRAAVDGFIRHFSVARVNALGLLPLHHVSGLMAWLRCRLTGGEYRHAAWKRIEAGERPELPDQAEGWSVSLVPTQLARLLQQPEAVDWLRNFRIIFLGGGPAWPALLDEAARQRLPLSPVYGMTETAAMVTALLPKEFLAGARHCGRALPHAMLSLSAGQRVAISAASLFRGYFPEWRSPSMLLTNDVGVIGADRGLTVLGRQDAVIISGGEKILPDEVEAALRATGEFEDVVVVGLPDPEWGQLVTAAYAASREPDWTTVQSRIGGALAAFKRPKHFVRLDPWPRSGAGKVDRAAVTQQVLARQKRE